MNTFAKIAILGLKSKESKSERKNLLADFSHRQQYWDRGNNSSSSYTNNCSIWWAEIMRKHHPMQSCADFIAKPQRRLKGVVAQCEICGTKFIGVIGYVAPHWKPLKLIKGEQK